MRRLKHIFPEDIGLDHGFFNHIRGLDDRRRVELQRIVELLGVSRLNFEDPAVWRLGRNHHCQYDQQHQVSDDAKEPRDRIN